MELLDLCLWEAPFKVQCFFTGLAPFKVHYIQTKHKQRSLHNVHFVQKADEDVADAERKTKKKEPEIRKLRENVEKIA